jgi:hypothetical protein
MPQDRTASALWPQRPAAPRTRSRRPPPPAARGRRARSSRRSHAVPALRREPRDRPRRRVVFGYRLSIDGIRALPAGVETNHLWYRPRVPRMSPQTLDPSGSPRESGSLCADPSPSGELPCEGAPERVDRRGGPPRPRRQSAPSRLPCQPSGSEGSRFSYEDDAIFRRP